MNDTTAALLAKLKAKTNPDALAPDSINIAQVAKDVETVEANPVIKTEMIGAKSLAPPALVAEYQQYTAAKVSTCLITSTGKRINFTNYQYYTKDPEIIRYLDREIANGLIGFIRGKMLTAAELDPETAKKREIIEEFKASQEGREFGDTKSIAERTTALTSGQVASSN